MGAKETARADARTSGGPDGRGLSGKSVDPQSGADAALDQQRAVERAEHRANLLRLRPGMTYAVGLWITFALADWAGDAFISPGSLSWLLGIRALILPLLLGALARLYISPEPTPRQTRILIFAMFSSAAVGLSLMCVGFEGLRSIYFGGILVALACRGALVAESWREGVWSYLWVASAYPAVLLTSTWYSPLTRAQLDQPDAVAAFVIQAAFLYGTAGLTLMAGHAYWALRRQVFESRSIGRYRLKRQIGSGGMGEVWSAYHSALRRDVALKILRSDTEVDTASVQRFEREVQAMTELTHPNTVRVFDYGVTDDGIWYYAMELLDGVDMRELVDAQGPLVPARAVYLTEQAARALGEAHLCGIYHRDIKPENLFVTRAGTQRDFVKVLDFGIARITQDVDATLTQTGSVFGTPAYMSPEVIAGKRADARADVYALGAVLYFALTGAPPFQADSVAALLLAHAQIAPTPPSQRSLMPIPEDLETIVLRCLAKHPDTRFADASQLVLALASCSVAGAWDPLDAPPLPNEPLPGERSVSPDAETAVQEVTDCE